MQKKTLVGFGILLAIIVIGASTFFIRNERKGINNRREIQIGAARFSVEIADTETKRSKGLGGHAELSMQEGMLFRFDKPTLPAFWMKDMNFPIDMIWIKENKVIGFTENIDTQIGASDAELKLYKPLDFVDNVLELRAGATQALGIKRGDILSYITSR